MAPSWRSVRALISAPESSVNLRGATVLIESKQLEPFYLPKVSGRSTGLSLELGRRTAYDRQLDRAQQGNVVIDEILEDADERMGKTLDALANTFGKIRTGRANPALLDGITVDYYGVATPLNQVASVSVEDARTLLLAPWERPLVVEIEKAILRSEFVITPVNNGEVVRIPLPPLTEENRRDLAKQAKAEAENSRISIRNIRRDAIADIRELVKEKEASEDEARRGEDRVQEHTDRRTAQVDSALAAKESELMEI